MRDTSWNDETPHSSSFSLLLISPFITYFTVDFCCSVITLGQMCGFRVNDLSRLGLCALLTRRFGIGGRWGQGEGGGRG